MKNKKDKGKIWIIKYELIRFFKNRPNTAKIELDRLPFEKPKNFLELKSLIARMNAIPENKLKIIDVAWN